MTKFHLVPSYQMERKLYSKILRAHRHLSTGLSAAFTPPKTHTQASSLIPVGHGAQRRQHITTCHQPWLNPAIGDSDHLIPQLVTSAGHWARHCLALSSTMSPAAAWAWGCLLVGNSRWNRDLPQLPVLLPRDCGTLCEFRFPNHLQPSPLWVISTGQMQMAIVQKGRHMELSFQEKERSNLWEKKGRKYWGRQLTLPSMFYLPVLMNQ